MGVTGAGWQTMSMNEAEVVVLVTIRVWLAPYVMLPGAPEYTSALISCVPGLRTRMTRSMVCEWPWVSSPDQVRSPETNSTSGGS